MHSRRLTYLLDLYLDDRLSESEQDELNAYLRQDDPTGEIRSALRSIIQVSPELMDYQKEEWDPLFEKIQTLVAAKAPSGRIRRLSPAYRKLLAIAACLLLFTGAIWLLMSGKEQKKPFAIVAPASPAATDIAPGSNKATLTLADNSTISLDDAKNGVLSKQGNMQLIKQKDGQLTYQATGHAPASAAHQYNVLTTPRGGQYQLMLPDGSKVWLNAASSLRYPTTFSGNQRTVELKGEAYFEIASNVSMPFRVKVISDKMDEPTQVDVLGTHFDVNAYTDEPTIHTTLLEGAIKVSKGAAAVQVRPGEEAHADSKGALTVNKADVEEVVAWKNGLFKFNEATIEDVMRQVSRWYDVEAVYVNGVPGDLFQGEIYRSSSLSKLLKILEASGVHFTIEGKKILVKA